MQAPSQTTSSTTGVSASTLPPAAIALAGKLFDHARTGNPELTTYVSAGIPPNLTNHKGDTLLMLAAYHGQADTVAMLLAKGADPDVLNDRGQSPMAGAVFKGHNAVVEVLFRGVETENGGWSRRADIWGGQPNAVDSARLFRKESYLALWGVEDAPVPGRVDGPAM